jgi:lysophospholipase L1-like esterase
VSANGSRAVDVVDQLPLLTGERYAVACLSVGANDVLFDWDAEAFRRRLGTIVTAAGAVAERVVVPTVTRGLGRFPGSGPVLRRRVEEANAALATCGALVIAGDDLRGPRLLQPDRIHPTLEGQLLLADRAASALGLIPAPSSLVDAPPSAARWAYHRVGAGQVPRRALKRALRRPAYRDPRVG